ncbi:MAG: ABC transporter permease [Bacilli bacterium]|nr:ABC transporter permease [Bacilli bacterium]MBQ8534757.1 ABC transporter permease [Bacilli bacterium]
MKLNNIKITLFKELRGIFRDKKTIQKLILYPLIIPIFIIMFGFLFDTMSTNNYVIGTNYKLSNDEKMIIEDLDAFKTKSYKNKKELDKAYKEDKIDGYIIKEGNTYTIYSDRTVNSGEIIVSNISAYLETYNLAIGSNYLLKNDVDPNKVFNNLIIETKSLKEDNTDVMVSLLFNIVITYVIMIVVMVGVIIVPDATSGEKERGTLETILTFPIKSSELVVGKYLATAIMSFLVGVAAYLLSIPTFSIGNKLFESYESVTFTTEFGFIILAILVIFLVSLLSAGVCMALAGKAKTYKEAQSSLQMISVLPMIPYFLSILEIDNIIFDFIPVANCSALLNDIVINNINIQSFLIIILTTIVYTVVILFYISKQYKSEETLFS